MKKVLQNKWLGLVFCVLLAGMLLTGCASKSQMKNLEQKIQNIEATSNQALERLKRLKSMPKWPKSTAWMPLRMQRWRIWQLRMPSSRLTRLSAWQKSVKRSSIKLPANKNRIFSVSVGAAYCFLQW